jgi:predicted NBD/HSP70 family sugar kinase
MAHYVGLDVSVRHTSICIVDDVGKVVREASPKLMIRLSLAVPAAVHSHRI